MHGQLGERDAEAAVRKREAARQRRTAHRPQEARAGRRDERAGRIDRRDGTGAQALCQLRGQGPGSAADIQHPLTSPPGLKNL